MSLRWTAESYERVRRAFPQGSRRLGLLRICYMVLSIPMYCGYPVLLLALYRAQSPQFWRVLLVPAAAFVLCTVLRSALNRPRPYEQPGFEPLVEKSTQGRSFPSRHAACAVIIMLAAWYASPGAAGAFTVIALLICAVRVLAGVHHPADVLAGAALSLLVGGIGFWLL